MIILQIAAIFLLSLVLVKGADQVIIAIRRIAQSSHVAAFTVASLILALATSFPELFVGIASALTGAPSLSLGNVIGANIANLAVVVGLAGLIGGGIAIKDKEFIKQDLPLALLAGLAPIVLLWNRELSRLDGLLLLLLYGAYAGGLFQKKFVEIGKVHQQEGFWHKIIRSIETGNGHARAELVRLFLGSAVMLVSAHFIVKVALGLAAGLNVPVFVVGLLLVALGTTLPEFTFSIRAIQQGTASLLVGNALGSIIVNATLIIGIVALIHPIQVVARREYLLAAIVFSVLILVFWVFTRTKAKLDRWEVGVLFLIYIIFVVLELSGFKFF